MNDQQVMIKNLLKTENSMEIDCVFAKYNLKIIKRWLLIHDEKFLMKMMKILLNELRYNNHFYGEFQMDVLLEAILSQLVIQIYKYLYINILFNRHK